MPRDASEDKWLKVTLSDISAINQAIPRSQIPLRTALKGRLIVELKDGSSHLMDEDELLKLFESLPSWMTWLVKVPFILVYNPESSLFRVLGDEWQDKAIRWLLGVDSSGPLKMEHVERLVMDYGTLVFILFAIDYKEIIRGDSL